MRRWFRLFRTLRFYSILRQLPIQTGDDIEYWESNDWKQVKDLLVTSDIDAQPYLEDRFRFGDRFACLLNSDRLVISYGWYTHRALMPISEVGLLFRTYGDAVLFDFFTPSAFQRRGYYTRLLRMITEQQNIRRAWIYVQSSNGTSSRCIERCGFRRSSVLFLILCGRFC